MCFSWVFSRIVHLIPVIEHFQLPKTFHQKWRKKEEEKKNEKKKSMAFRLATFATLLLYSSIASAGTVMSSSSSSSANTRRAHLPRTVHTSYQFTFFRTDIFHRVWYRNTSSTTSRKWCTDGTWRLMMIYFRLDVWQNTIRAKHK